MFKNLFGKPKEIVLCFKNLFLAKILKMKDTSGQAL